MSAKSIKQQKFFGAELARKRAGKKTETGLSQAKLKEFASTKHRNLPLRKKKGKKVRMSDTGMVRT